MTSKKKLEKRIRELENHVEDIKRVVVGALHELDTDLGFPGADKRVWLSGDGVRPLGIADGNFKEGDMVTGFIGFGPTNSAFGTSELGFAGEDISAGMMVGVRPTPIWVLAHWVDGA